MRKRKRKEEDLDENRSVKDSKKSSKVEFPKHDKLQS